jgi:hypothetical protein
LLKPDRRRVTRIGHRSRARPAIETVHRRPALPSRPADHIQGDIVMGKYLIGWLLGVPVFVLVILYFFFH